MPGAYKLINHGKAISPAMRNSVVITLAPDGEITGAATGRWEVSHRGDFTVDLEGTTYRGVATTEWDDDHGASVYAFTALSGDGVAVWGSQTVVAKHPPRAVALPARARAAAVPRAVTSPVSRRGHASRARR